ncbi:S41 family peptidase [Nannocystaceae bacterium ST9]
MLRSPSPRAALVIGLVLGIGGTLVVQAGVGEALAGKPSKTAAATIDRQQFHDALDLVLDRHVDPVDPRVLMSEGLKHMAGALDAHSSFLTAEERELARKREQQGADAGLVVRLIAGPLGDDQSQVLEVVAITPGGSAEREGIAVGDMLLEVRGQASARMLSVAEAQILLAGAPGETIDLELLRAGRSRGESITLELRKPDVDALVHGELIHAGDRAVGLIAIRSFRAGVGERFKQQLAELRRAAGKSGLSGIVLDLRGNPGGVVDEAVVIADAFVEEGILTRTRGRGGKILGEERATAAGTDTSTPLIVLQDARSASASELLAVALQDHRRATIVGERSFGKGTVQERIGLPDGSLLTLTTARYFSPDDRSIDGRGVEPDVAVADASSDAALEAAIHLLDK